MTDADIFFSFPHYSLKFKEPPRPVAPHKKKISWGEGGSVDSGWGDTVHSRIALWEGKGMGEALGTCRDLLALVAEELK